MVVSDAQTTCDHRSRNLCVGGAGGVKEREGGREVPPTREGGCKGRPHEATQRNLGPFPPWGPTGWRPHSPVNPQRDEAPTGAVCVCVWV